MIPQFALSAGGLILRNWKLALVSVLLLAITMLKVSLDGEQRHSARLEQRLSETAAAFDRFRADIAARTAIAKAQDEAHMRRVERDQMIINQETVSAYQQEIVVLRARAARRLRAGTATADTGGGGGTPVSGVSHSSAGTDGAAGEDGFPPGDALIASEIAVRLGALQDWVRAQERVDR